MLRLQVLRSSSRGSATLLWDEQTALMIDCGIGPRVADRMLEAVGMTLRDLDCVLITHSHQDHAKPSMVLAFARAGVRVFCPPGVKAALLSRESGSARQAVARAARTVSGKAAFRVGTVTVKPFQTEHDSQGGSLGYCVCARDQGRSAKVSLVTDFAPLKAAALRHLRNSDVLLISSDHDPVLLDQYPIPEEIKEFHIRAYHPSNQQCADTVVDVLRKSRRLPQLVALMHISEYFNTRQKAVRCTRRTLRKARFGKVKVIAAGRLEATKVFQVEGS